MKIIVFISVELHAAPSSIFAVRSSKKSERLFISSREQRDQVVIIKSVQPTYIYILGYSK
jgi:hypothetical protein